jgi:O-antigen/teichoic acid export membrane protein
MLIREHRFKALSTLELAAAAAASCVGIGLALGGHGVFSLVFQELTREVVRCAGAFLLSGYRPGAPPPVTAMASVLRFGAGGLGVAFLVQADRQAPRLIIGLSLGAQALGIFTLAMKLFDTLSQLVLGPLGAVAMSTVARLQHSLPALRALVAGSMRVTAGLAAPGFLGLAAMAPVLVPAVFGASWAEAVATAQILLLIGIRSSASAFNIAILRGVGMSSEPIFIVAVSAILTTIMTAIAVPFGVLAVATAIMLRSYSTWPLGAWYVKRAIGLGIVDQAKAGALPIAAALAMAAIVYGFVIAANAPLGAWPTIALAPLLGVLLYALLLRIVAPGDFGAVLRFIKTRQTSLV